MLAEYTIVITHKYQTSYAMVYAPKHVFTSASLTDSLIPSISSKTTHIYCRVRVCSLALTGE